MNRWSAMAVLGWLFCAAGCATVSERPAEPVVGSPAAVAPPAARAAGRADDPAEILASIAQLGSARYQERVEAERRLEEAWRQSLPVLLEWENADDPEVRMRVREVVGRVRAAHKPADCMARGAECWGSGRLDDAIAAFSDAILLAPARTEAYLARGMTFGKAGRFQEAIEDMNRAAELDPSNTDVYFQRARQWWDMYEMDRVIEDLSRILEIDPSSEQAYLDRANAWLSKHVYDKALADFARVIEMDSENFVAYACRSSVWLEKEQYDRAIQDATKALSLSSGFEYALMNRAWAFAKDAQAPQAIQDYEAALADDPDKPLAQAGLGFSLYLGKRPEEAREAYERAMAAPTNSASACNLVAWIHATCPIAELRNGPAAVTNALEACRLSKYARGELVDTLAAAYAEAGDFTNAVKWAEKTLEMFPEERRQEFYYRLDLYRHGKPYREDGAYDVWALERKKERGKANRRAP